MSVSWPPQVNGGHVICEIFVDYNGWIQMTFGFVNEHCPFFRLTDVTILELFRIKKSNNQKRTTIGRCLLHDDLMWIPRHQADPGGQVIAQQLREAQEEY